VRVHLFSLGKRHDVCERCGVHFGTKSGNECAGEDLTPREAALVAAAKDHGYAEGIRDASQSVRALYDIASNNGGRGCSPLELYRKLQDLGDLVELRRLPAEVSRRELTARVAWCALDHTWLVSVEHLIGVVHVTPSCCPICGDRFQTITEPRAVSK
jgi:hypothetical protein